MQSSRSLTVAALLQVVAGIAAVLLMLAFMGGEFRDPASLLSPNTFLGLMVVTCGVFVWSTRRRTRLTAEVVRDRTAEAGPLPEHSPVRLGLFTLRVHGSGAKGAEFLPPPGAVWAEESLISSSMFDQNEFPLMQWGIQSFDSIAALQQSVPEGNLVALVGRVHPRTTTDEYVPGASMSDAVTPLAGWAKPGTIAAVRLHALASRLGIEVVDEIEDLVADADGLDVGLVPIGRMPRRRFFFSTYWHAPSNADQKRARRNAFTAVSAAGACVFSAVAVLVTWALGGGGVVTGAQVTQLAIGGCLLLLAAGLYPFARRLDNRYGASLQP